ncbi:MAG: hypothetical protein GY742_22645 [Hyphomicrobiales bacterium]|nr:hypothetical protein [Hyphomicrobiales bacterium]
MNQSVRIQGASSWSKLSGFQQLATLLLDKLIISKRTAKLLQSAASKRLNGQQAHPGALFLAYFCSFTAISTLLIGL